MTIPDLIAGILAACAMIGAYIMEWRRGNTADRLIAAEQRIAALESQEAALVEVQKDMAAMKEAFERLRRNL